MRRYVHLVSVFVSLFMLASVAAATPPRLVTSQASWAKTGLAALPSTRATPNVAVKNAVQVALRPAVVRVQQQASIIVSGIHPRSLDVRLAGATSENGTPLPWRSLRSVDGAWVGSLPMPSLRGIYRVMLRTGAGTIPFGSPRWLLRVFALGTRSRPAFDKPVDVAKWWVQAVAGGTLVELKAWPRPGFDRREVRLHRLFVVAYSPSGQPQIDDRLGMFVTAVRDGYHGRWRLLEATVWP
jgi:hypothetical protein